MGVTANLEVTGRAVLGTDGRAEAMGALTDLVAAGARVRLVAPHAATAVADLAARALIIWERRAFVPADLSGMALLVCRADDRPALAAAAAAGVPAWAVPAPAGGPERTGLTGSVILVGGGPGDPGLITLAGRDAVRSADVIICDRLAPLGVLREARPEVVIIDVSKVPRGSYTPQEQINDLLVSHARAGRRVVRLKGGDSFVFGRGGEEWQACARAGVAVEIIPGVSSATAAPALAGIPLTHRTLTQGFSVVSGHLPPGDPESTLDWAALARANTTLVIMMGVATLPAITATLVGAGLAGDTPSATVASAGLPGQRTVRGTLDTIAALTADAGITPPAITIIGAVAAFDPRA